MVTVSDALLIAATLTSPVIAVQVQKFIERVKERRSAQRRIFYALMGTRATRLAFEHVQALNMIDLEFSGSGWRGMSAREKEVVDKWRIYADHLNQGGAEDNNEARAQVWFERGDELFTDLLEALASALGYSFDRVQLRRGIYRPRGLNEQELRQQTIERALARVLTGDAPLSMKVIDFPTSDDAIKLQTEVYERMREALAEDGALKVKTVA